MKTSAHTPKTMPVKWKKNGGKNVALFWAYEQMFSLAHEIWGIMDSDGSDNFA
jgi:hypothetical protein